MIRSCAKEGRAVALKALLSQLNHGHNFVNDKDDNVSIISINSYYHTHIDTAFNKHE